MYAVTAVVGAYSAYQSSASAKAQSEFAQDQANYNATIAGYQRDSAIAQGGAEAIEAQRKAQRIRGAQVAKLAGNGIDISTGSALSLLDDTDFFSQRDAYQIRNNAAKQAWGHQVNADSLTASGEMHGAAAKAEKPGMAAGISLLSSASQFAPQISSGIGKFKAGRSLDQSMNTSGLW